MIDLGIAFESIYLSDDDRSALAFRLRLHAALYLRKNKGDRKLLMKEFQKIYKWRSSAVHTGRLPKKTKNEEVADFLAIAQDLCRDSILKIIENGEFPDWNKLILGE